MKTLLLALLVLAPVALFAEPTPVSSQINSATVYRDRAVVTRSAHVELTAGETQLTFDKLPATLVDQSLQVSGRGTASATILDVSARTTFVEATPDARVKALEDEIKAIAKKERTLKDRAAVLEQQRALVARIETSATTPPSKESTTTTRPTFDEWQKLITFADDNRSKLTAEQQSLDTQHEELDARKSALEEQLNQLRGQAGGDRSFKTVVVRVSAAKAGSLDLSLAYTVPGASWTPSYDARLRAEERAVELTYFGIVRQATGEDWKAIALTLSTASPSLGGGAPELNPWIVDVVQPITVDLSAATAYKVKRAKPPGEVQAFNRVAAAPSQMEGRGMVAVEETDASLATATVDSSATSASFKIAAAATILSDNTPQKVGITSAKLAAKLQYQSTPRAQETAFLSAYVINSTDFPFLAGSMNTFLDDTFIATSSLKTVMAGEKFELALGADEGIAIKRKLVNRFAEDTGLTSKGRRVTYEFLTTVMNNKKTTERVVFKDLLPISRNEKIIVKLLGPDPKDVGTKDKPKEVSLEDDGKMIWRIDIKPGEKREIQFKFSVEHPADVTVTGLE
ncbi:MAG: mucoidy inhibitor MuiA family protein [Verrucomicrobia bacterium]|nr:mucoidy inhibitor MuiA family protein [Verrucomicrobiota bacterium]